MAGLNMCGFLCLNRLRNARRVALWSSLRVNMFQLAVSCLFVVLLSLLAGASFRVSILALLAFTAASICSFVIVLGVFGCYVWSGVVAQCKAFLSQQVKE